jgi:hypothetical protein
MTELIAAGHVFDPAKNTGIHWEPQIARLFHRSQTGTAELVAEAAHETSSAWEFWHTLRRMRPSTPSTGLATRRARSADPGRALHDPGAAPPGMIGGRRSRSRSHRGAAEGMANGTAARTYEDRSQHARACGQLVGDTLLNQGVWLPRCGVSSVVLHLCQLGYPSSGCGHPSGQGSPSSPLIQTVISLPGLTILLRGGLICTMSP